MNFIADMGFFLYFRGVKHSNKEMKRVIWIAGMAVCMVCSCSRGGSAVERERAAQRAQDSVRLAQCEQTVLYSDSVLQVLLGQADSLMGQFVYKRDARYEDNGHYIEKAMERRNVVGRNSLYACLDDNRRPVVISRYAGAAINHDCLTLESEGNRMSFGGETYRFVSDGLSYETLTLTGDSALMLLRMVDSYADSPITVRLSGRGQYAYSLDATDKNSLITTCRLCVLTSDIHRLEQQMQQASRQAETLQKRLQKQ